MNKFMRHCFLRYIIVWGPRIDGLLKGGIREYRNVIERQKKMIVLLNAEIEKSLSLELRYKMFNTQEELTEYEQIKLVHCVQRAFEYDKGKTLQ